MSEPDTEDRILEAALHAFARKGRDGARTQEIADAAGINKAMLHYYFRNKERLYEAVFLYVFRKLMASFGHTVIDAPTFEETLRALIDGYIGFISQNLDVVRFLVNENLSGAPVMGPYLKQMLEASEPTLPRAVVSKISMAVESGELREVDPFQTLLTILSACVFPFVIAPTVSQIGGAAGRESSEFLAERRRHVFDLLYHGLKRPSPS
jgi:TetR/AcrR family transcriptional regulator